MGVGVWAALSARGGGARALAGRAGRVRWQVGPGGRCAGASRCGGPSAVGSGPGNLLGRAGKWRSGPSASRWALRDGPLRRLGQAESGCFGYCWADRVWVSFYFYFYFSFLFLIQTKFEFKYKFEFKQHSSKNMHQHECNTKIKPMTNFKSLRNKIELNALLNTINLRNLNKAN